MTDPIDSPRTDEGGTADEKYQKAMETLRDDYPTFDWFDLDSVVGQRLSDAAAVAEADQIRDERDWLRTVVESIYPRAASGRSDDR